MPLLKISTNQPVDKTIKEEFLKQVSELLASELGKSEQYVMTVFNAEVSMTFAGKFIPAAYVEIKSIGLTPGQSANLSNLISKVINDKIGIPATSIYIEFTNAEGALWGWNGTTF